MRKMRQLESNRRYYLRRRGRLIAELGAEQILRFGDLLGARCEDCWRVGQFNNYDLEFDHKDGHRGWCMKKKGPFQRLVILEREAKEGKLQLLCGRHNGRKKDQAFDELAAELRGETTGVAV